MPIYHASGAITWSPVGEELSLVDKNTGANGLVDQDPSNLNRIDVSARSCRYGQQITRFLGDVFFRILNILSRKTKEANA